MSRTFNGNVANYLSVASAVVTGAPSSFSAWFYANNETAGLVAIATTDNAASAQDELRLEMRGDGAGDPCRATAAAGGATGSSTGNDYAASVWNHGGALFTSATSRNGYLNGSAGTANTTNLTPVGISTTGVGVLVRPTPILPMDGSLAEVAAWNATLTDFEFAALAHGVSPMLVRPTSLDGYWPLFNGYSVSGEQNWHGDSAYNLAETGSVGNAAHPTKSLAYPVP